MAALSFYDDIYNRFRLTIQDTYAAYSVDPDDALGSIASWMNEAVAIMNRIAKGIPATGYLHPDGSKQNFDLATDLKNLAQSGDPLSFTPYTNFLKLRLVTICKSETSVGYGKITRHALGMKYIRDKGSISGGFIVRTPSQYAMDGATTIHFDSIMAAPADVDVPTEAELIKIDYYAKPATLIKDLNEEPEYPINERSFRSTVLAVMKYIAGPEIRGDIGKLIRKEGLDGMKDEFTGIGVFTAFVENLGHHEDADQPVASELGEDYNDPYANDEFGSAYDWDDLP